MGFIELTADPNLLYKKIQLVLQTVHSLINPWTAPKNHKLKLRKDNILFKILMKIGCFQGSI